MLRAKKAVVEVPSNITVTLKNKTIFMQNGNGELIHSINMGINVVYNNNFLEISLCKKNTSNKSKAMVGTTRALLVSMIEGLTNGFVKKLQLVGVGYRVLLEDGVVVLFVGFSHSISYKLPLGIFVECPSTTEIIIKGINKQLVGQVAANIRAYRPPEHFKGKGIRYLDEYVPIKESKKR